MRIGQAIDCVYQLKNVKYESDEGLIIYYHKGHEIVVVEEKETGIRCTALHGYFSKHKFRLVKEPVTFMEAFQALRRFKKDIYCQYKGGVYSYYESPNENYSFEGEHIDYGKWFIREEDHE